MSALAFHDNGYDYSDNLLRDVSFEGHRLVLTDTNRRDSMGKRILGYRLYGPGDDAVPIFEGEDFGCSPMHAADSDETLRSLLGFLTLRPGDTDDEYFEGYTPRQMAWVESYAEELSLWADDEAGQ